MSPRQQLSLDGVWTFSTDPQGIGLQEGWCSRSGFEREVMVPSPWQLYGEDLVGYTGYAWYHRFVEGPDWGEQRIFLRFDAVDYEARVWLNGVLLGTHEGGYTPFEFEITSALRPGPNNLVLRVYDPQDNSEIPHGKQGSWYTRVSGPWQPVRLEARPQQFVHRLKVAPDPKNGRAIVQVQAEGSDGTPVSLRILDPGGAGAASAEGRLESGEARWIVPLPEARLWSPEHPVLYTAIAELGGDRREARFGMRWVDYRDGLIYLNGKPLYIRGALDQAFYPETVYRPPSMDAIEREIDLAKRMGLNLLRKHIKLEDPRYLDACDRLGMLIWEEPACYAKHTPQARDRFRREIEAMIDRDYNHPSIVAWSLYNEEWGLEWRLWKDKDKQRHVEALFNLAKSLDPTRLICDNSGWAHVKTDLNDWHRYFSAPDLIAEWREDLAHCVERPETNFVASKQDNARGVPVLISEFGVWGLPEPSRITRWYGGRPWWFDAQWAGHTEEFKYPATAERHFKRFGLDRAFANLDDLAIACQKRMMRGLKPLIEEMRKRPDLAGYVVTEFTDIEWETNGWLDYFREPKADFDDFMAFNGPLVVMADLDRHNLWSGEDLELRFSVSNHLAQGFEGAIRWSIPNHGLHGEIPVHIEAFASGPVADLRVPVPTVEGSVASRLEFELLEQGTVKARNAEELTFSSRSSLGPPPGPLALRGEARRLEPMLRETGAVLDDSLGDQTLMLTTTLDAEAQRHLQRGGRVLFVAERGEGCPEKGMLSFRRLPRGESWDRAASILYVRPGTFDGLPLSGILGWELEGVFPHHVVPISRYLQDFGGRLIELPSNQEHVDPEGILGGYFEGWIGKFGATILKMPYEQGQLLVTTLRLLEGYGRQPIATLALHRLIENVAAVQVGALP